MFLYNLGILTLEPDSTGLSVGEKRGSSGMNGMSHRGGISLFIYSASLNELFLSAGLALLSAVKNRNLCNDSVRSDQMSTKGKTGSRSTGTGGSTNCIIYRISGERARVI